MKKRTTAILLAAHAVGTWIAVPLRIDEFPLTWAPMYSLRETSKNQIWKLVLKDLERLEQEGWRAVRADASEERVRRVDLNVSPRSLWRLYFERTWNEAPPRYRHKNAGGATLDRWILGIPPGAPIYAADWDKQLLMSVNHTLGRTPGAPDFIVSLHAERVRMHFDSISLRKVAETHETAAADWQPLWDLDFD